MAEHVCPPWIGWLLASPIRKLVQNPDRIVGPHLRPGMTALDVGCAMGFFSLPMARLVGDEGRVICVDVQEPMIRSLTRRAERAGLSGRVDPRLCNGSGLGLADVAGQVDFALAFAVVHEVDDPAAVMRELFEALAPGGRLLFSEPSGHVSDEQFAGSVQLAEDAGFVVLERTQVARGMSVLLGKD